MIYTKEVENMCPVAKGAKHEPAPIPEEGKWVHSKKIEKAGSAVVKDEEEDTPVKEEKKEDKKADKKLGKTKE